MKDTKLDIRDIEFWWDKRSFIRTISICVLVYGVMMLWIEHVTPPEGYVFERLPAITGPWWSGHCGNGFNCARVGNTPVGCSIASYFPLGGGNRGLCGHLKIPNGKVVTAIHVKTPMMNKRYNEYLAFIKSGNEVYQFDDDAKIRADWIWKSRTAALNGFFILFIVFYFSQLAKSKIQRE